MPWNIPDRKIGCWGSSPTTAVEIGIQDLDGITRRRAESILYDLYSRRCAGSREWRKWFGASDRQWINRKDITVKIWIDFTTNQQYSQEIYQLQYLKKR